MKLVGSYSMAESIKQLREDSTVRAVVLRIESPGGSSLASDVMWRELALLAKKKPLIVSMGSVAASGGYYVASASKDIYALPLTITGSIGVFYGKADVSGLLGKIGVTIDTYKTAPRADAESLFRGFTPDERKELEHKVDQFYDTFLDRVSQGRGHDARRRSTPVGRGRVWTGQQASSATSSITSAGLREALADARTAAYLPEDAPIVEYPPREHVADRSGAEARGRRRAGAIDGLGDADAGVAAARGASHREVRRAAARLPERRAAGADGVGGRRGVSTRRRRRGRSTGQGGEGGTRPASSGRCSRWRVPPTSPARRFASQSLRGKSGGTPRQRSAPTRRRRALVPIGCSSSTRSATVDE